MAGAFWGKAAGRHIVYWKFINRSERDSSSDLPEPRLMRGRGEAEVTIREVDVRIGIIRAIEEVEHFESELEVDSFRDGRVFVEIDVCLKEVRPAELVRLLIAALPEGWDGKISLGDRSARKPGLIVCGLVIADGIWVIQIFTICVVVAATRRVAHRRICRRWASRSGR